jgi:hypothetical protein
MFHNDKAEAKNIRNILEGYRRGFPVIKELIQNSNDANASELIIRYTDQTQDFQNPLLKKVPTLVVVNDGAFTFKDVNAINHTNDSGKDDQITIGKFGIGLNSVFHYCEGFFYLASRLNGSKTDLKNAPRHDYERYLRTFNFVTPWSSDTDDNPYYEWTENYNKNWEQDKQTALKLLSKQIEGKENWFALLIPLRMKDIINGRDYILADVFDELLPQVQDDLFNDKVYQMVCNILPMLHKLRKVSFFIDGAEKNVIEHYEVKIPSPHDIDQNYQKNSTIKNNLSGIVSSKSDKSENDTNYSLIYDLTFDDEARALYNDAKSKQHKVVPPNAAILITQNNQNKQNAKVEFDYSNTLPLTKSERLVNAKYHIFIHGSFFVDSKRQSFELEFSGEDQQERNKQIQWNRVIYKKALTLFISCLHDFYTRYEVSLAEMDQISRVIIEEVEEKAANSIPEYLTHICSENMWAAVVADNRAVWKLIPKEENYYIIDKDFINYIENMSTLAEVCNSHNFVCKRYNNIVLQEKQKPWLPEHWNAFMSVNAKNLIRDSGFLNYWIKELEYQLKQSNVEREALSLINGGLKRLILSLDFKEIERHGEEIKKLLNQIKDKVITLKVSNETIWRDINDNIDEYIALPDSYKKYIIKDDEPIKLPYRISIQALRFLAENNESLQKQCEIIADGILSQTQEDDRDDEYLKLPFIRVKDLSGNISFFSLEKMKSECVIMSPKDNLDPIVFSRAFNNLPVYLSGFTYYADSAYNANKLNLRFIEANYLNWEFGELEYRVALIKHFNDLSFKELKEYKNLVINTLSGKITDRDRKLYLYKKESAFYKVASRLWDKQEKGYDKIILGNIGIEEDEAENMGILTIDSDIPESLLNNNSNGLKLEELSLEDRESIYKEINIMNNTKLHLLQLPIFETISSEFVGIDCYQDKVKLLSPSFSQKELPETNRIILKYNEVLDKHTNIPKIDNKTMIEIYLEDEQPAKYQEQIIESLLKLEPNTINAIYELGERPWMIVNGKETCPKNILYHPHITKQIQSILDYFYIENPGGQLCGTREDLPEEYRARDLEDKLKNMAVWEAETVCAKIGQVISQTTGLNLYVIDDNTNSFEEFNFWEPALRTLDIYKIIDQCSHSISNDYLEKYFYPNVFKQNPPLQARITILSQLGKYLNELSSYPDEYEKCYNKYLTIFRKYLEPNSAKEILESIKLPNIQKKWLPTDQLCLEEDIIPKDNILDKEIRDILCDEQYENIISQANVEELGEQDDFPKHELLEYLQRIANHIDKTLVGVFLSFLADGDTDWSKWASEKFLSGHQTVDSIREKVKSEWKNVIAPVHRGEAFIKARHKDVDENFWTYTIRLKFISIPERIIVKSILGNDIETNSNDSFLRFIKKDEAENTYDFEFYKVDLDSLNLLDYDLVQSSIEGMLFQALNLVISKCYGIPPLQSQIKRLVWDDCKTDNQASIFYAQRTVKKNIDGIFKRLKIANKSKKAQELMDRYGSIDMDIAKIEDRQKSLVASMADDEEKQEKNNELSEQHKNLLEKQEEVIKGIELSLSDEDIHMALLSGMREELASHQYSYSSIMFELFQNADDACIELDAMDRRQEDYYFQVKTNDELTDIYVIHNGRFINEHQGNVESNVQSRRYQSDLENMLNLNYSDKSNDEVTGKFGLGFKSIYLATDNPQVVSGKLHFKVRGGVYPEALNDEELNSLKNQIDDDKGRSEGTVIAIKSINDEAYDEVINEFKNNLELLPLFSKKISNIFVNHKLTYSNIEVIRENIFKYETNLRKYMCFSSNNAWLIVFAFEDKFIDMSKDICRTWVTVPVLDSSNALPCIINARFALDHGRKQLASNESNRELMETIGEDFYNILASLYIHDVDEQHSIDFYCNQDVDYYLFWSSLFELLTGNNRNLNPDVCQLENVLWGKNHKSYRSFIENHKVVPSLINHMPAHLICLKDIKYKLAKEFDGEKSINILKELGVDFDSLVSIKTFNKIHNLSDPIYDNIKELDYVELVKLIFPDRKFETEKANILGILLGLKRDSISAETKREITDSLLFEALDGSWKKSKDVVPIIGDCSDLKGFMPNASLLHNMYSNIIVEYFFDIGDVSKTIIHGMYAISDKASCKHALSYILNHFEDFFKKYNTEILAMPWIKDIDLLKEVSVGFNKDNLQKLEELIKLIISKDLKTETGKYSYKWFKNLLFALSYAESEQKGTNKQETVIFRKHKISEDRRILQLSDPSRYLIQSYETAERISLTFYDDKDNTVENSIKGVSVTEAYVEVMFDSRLSDEVIEQMVPGTIFKLRFEEFRDVKQLWRIAYDELAYNDDDSLKEELSQNIEFIYGPPGTGKTYELASRITGIAAECSNILALTPTNVAADQILLKLDEQNSQALHDTKRFGNCTNTDIHEGGWVAHSGSRRENNKITITTAIRFPYDGYKNGKFINQKWDYIIFDEASMLPIHYITYVIIKASEVNPDCKFIIGGDPLQIPPIYSFPIDGSSTTNDDDIKKQINSMKEDVSDETIYTMVGLSDFKEKPEDYKLSPYHYKVLPLTTQRRSIEPIGELFNHFSYGGIIKHASNIKESEIPDLPESEFFKPKPISIIRCPVIGGDVYRMRKIEGSSTHPYSAILALEYIKSIVNHLRKDISLGVICPYRSQADLVKKLLDEQNFVNLDYHADTIHGFQGGQKDIVFCLFNTPVRYGESGGNPSFTGGTSDKNTIMLNKKYIINVGISRARKYLFLLIPDEKYRDQDKRVGNYDRLIELNNLLNVVNDRIDVDSINDISSDLLEKHLFNRQDYILRNSINVSHDKVNVYSVPYKRYLISNDDKNIDIQIDYGESAKKDNKQ